MRHDTQDHVKLYEKMSTVYPRFRFARERMYSHTLFALLLTHLWNRDTEAEDPRRTKQDR
jgi:hypothetical protein